MAYASKNNIFSIKNIILQLKKMIKFLLKKMIKKNDK